MNKHCYRIIYSRTKGELQVVSELARSCSTMPGQTRSGGGARLWVTVRRAIWLISLALFAEPVAANGIVADGQAAAGLRPEVIVTQNGVPQVNINAPNQAGISHNQYQQFDVDQKGAILNNSAVMTSTQLAGYIQGNAKLNPNSAPAKVILNEVNSNNPSQLRGFLEVAGGKAQVIVANPSGIVCDGCGTINAGRMTLTTGKPQLNADGSLAGYQVERGVIRIEGGGLNGDSRHDTEYVDVLARAVKVNAGIWAKQGVTVVAGRNQVSADTKRVDALAGNDAAHPELAIDMGQMGGMYSGYIRMVGTEAGVGVRNQGGHLQADKTLTVSSEGKITWQAATSEPYTQAGGDIALAAKDTIEHHGKLHSGGQLHVQSREGEIRQSGTLAASGNVTLQSAKGISSSGHMLAGSDQNSALIRPADLTLSSQGDIHANGSLLSKQKINVTGKQVDINNSRLAAEQAVLTAKSGHVSLQQAQVDSQQFTVRSQGNVQAQQAKVRAGQWDISADNLLNQGGVWSQVGEGESRFTLTGGLDNTGGSIEAQQLGLNTAALNNNQGRLAALGGAAQHWQVGGLLTNHDGMLGSNSRLQLDTGMLDNENGTLQSQSQLAVSARQGVNNHQGKLLSGESLTLNSQAALDNSAGEILGQNLVLSTQGTVDNRTGKIYGQNLQLDTQSLNNAQGTLVSQGELQLNARQLIDNQQGVIEAGDRLDVNSEGGWDNRKGTVTGKKQVNVAAHDIDNTEGKLQSGGGLALKTAGGINNQSGALTAQQDLTWQGGAQSLLNNDAGKLLSDGAMQLEGGQLHNGQQGLVQSLKTLEVKLRNEWDNQGGKLTSAGSGTLRASGFLNTNGEIQALDTLDMQLTGNLDNHDGNIISQKALGLQADNIINNQGSIGSAGALTIATQHLDNRKGEVLSQQDTELSTNTLDNQQGTLQSAANMALHTLQDIYNQAGKISAQLRLSVQGKAAQGPTLQRTAQTSTSGVLHNAGGQLLAGELLQVDAQGIDNQQNGMLYSQKHLQLTLNDNLDNRLGKLQSGESTQISAKQLLNTQGVIDSQQQLGLRIIGLLDNNGGTLRANQAQQISADVLQNHQGTISSLGDIALTTNQLDNHTGIIISQGAGDYQLGQLNNQQGKLHSGGRLRLGANTVDNQGGQLVSAQALDVKSQQIDNHNQGIISSQDALTVHTQQLNNRDGGALIGTTHTEINAQSLDNTAGRLQSVGTLTLSQLNTLNNQQGKILSGNALSINTGLTPSLTLLNQSGNIQSNGTLTANTQSLNNQGGTLLSQQALTLSVQQDYTHQAGDTISSNSGVVFSVAGTLTNLAEWLLPGDLRIQSANFTNLASLVGKNLHLTTRAVLNKGRIEANQLTLQSDTLDNQATLMGDRITVNSRTLDNHGREALIAATEQLSLLTGETLINRDAGFIYSAGTLHLSSNDLIENRASNIEAEGDIILEAKRFNNLREGLEIEREAEKTDYKWHRYNYYWRSYGSGVNNDESTIAATTQKLTFRDDVAAESNRYGTLLNIDATAKKAEVKVKNNRGELVSLWVNYKALTPNADGSYDMTFYETRGWHQNNVPTPYQNTVWREHNRGRLEQFDPEIHITGEDIPFVNDYNNLRERSVSGTRTTDKLISAGVGASLLSGGNMTLHIGEKMNNDASTVSSNGNLTIDGNGSVINQGYSVNKREEEYIVDHYDRDTKHWHPENRSDITTALMTIDAVLSGNGNVVFTGTHLENTTVNQAQISTVEAAKQAAAAERAEWERNPLSVTLADSHWQTADTDLAAGKAPLTPGELALTDKQHVAKVGLTIPDNALFRQQTAPNSPYLVVTDPRFTNKNNFISSDYMLQRVGYDPSQAHKRLGDGYYEQRLVREQLLNLTGRPSSHGEDAMTQYKSLMNNGIKVANDFHLVPGVALTPQQIAALQQDIVWMVSETVDTAQGPQTVWVPKVYLANSSLRLTGDGAVIAGGNLQLSTNSISNAGNLFADKALNIDTGQFLHQGGDIHADTLNVQADNIKLSTNLQDALRQASMSARELSLSGSDISLQGAKLSATDNLSLSASNNLSISTAHSSHTADLDVISGAMGNRKSEGMEEAGKRMAHVSGEWQQALGSSLNAGGNLSLQAGNDLSVKGSQAEAGGKALVQAGGNVSLLADTTTNNTRLQANSSTSSVDNTRREETLHTSALSGGKGVTIQSGGEFVAEGALVNSESGGIDLSAQQIMIKEAHRQVSDSDSESNKVGKTKSQRQVESSRDTSQSSVFSAKDGITATANQGDITLQGSTLHSEEGAIALQAKKNITLDASYDEQHLSEKSSSQKKGFLSSKQSNVELEEHSRTANGSMLSGKEISVSAGQDLTVKGSSVVGENKVSLQAVNNVDISAVTEEQSSYRLEEKKKKGVFSGGGLGFTIGSTSSRHEAKEKGTTQSQSVSTIGSTGGDVNIVAGGKAHIGGADVVASKDVNITGDSVQIDPGRDIHRRDETFEQKTSGLTVSLSGTAGSALGSAVESAQQAKSSSNSRLAALQGTKAALSGIQAVQAGRLDVAKGGDPSNNNTVGLSLSYGSQSSKSTQHSEQNIASGSSLTAGDNLNVVAHGKGGKADSGDINVQGSQLQAGKDITLNAQRDVNLQSAQNTQLSSGKNESHGSSVGAGIGVGSGGAGLSVSASTNKGRGSESGNGLTHSETTLNAGKQVTITSGRDTTLLGAQVVGETVKADVGRNMVLESQQDSDYYDSTQQNTSVGGSYTFGGGGGSLSVNLSRDKIHSNYDSVVEQTGIFAGKGGFDIKVGEHTQLNGAVIGSTATADKNRLETGTLGFKDIENKADFKAEHQGFGLSRGGSIGGQFAGNMANGLLVGANNEGHADSTTHAAVSEGSIIIRDKDKQQQDIADLSRDVEHANQTLSPIFDKEKEQQRLQQAQLIGEMSNQAMDIARTEGQIRATNAGKAELAAKGKGEPGKGASKAVWEDYNKQLGNTASYKAEMVKWGTGSDIQRAMQAATAAVQGLAGGNLKGAIAGGAAPYLAEVIHNMTTDAKTGKVDELPNLMAHAVVGAVVAQANGNSALAGATGAAMGEFIAQQMYPGVARADLTEEQKQTISALSTLAAGLAGGLTGDSTADTVAGAQAGKNAVENNSLSDIAEALAAGKTPQQVAKERVEDENERYKKENCAGMSAEACSVKMYDQRREELKGILSTGADFVPVVGTIKSAAEAQSALDYLNLAASLIPGERVASGVLKAAEKALAKGDVAEASKLVNKASDEIAIASRPSHRQSEIDVGKDLGSGWREQVSFKDGKEVPYGTKGGVRPDWCQGNICSVEVKNYNITTNKNGLINNVAKQAIERQKNLPAGMQQQVVIDIRGQSATAAERMNIVKGIVDKSNGAITPSSIRFKTE